VIWSHFRPNTGISRRFGAQRRLKGNEKGHQISRLRANSLRVRTGNFLRPYRELNRAIREISATIRESALDRYLAFALPTHVIVSTDPRTSPRRRRGGRRQMLEAAEADLALEADFCPCERCARHSGNRSQSSSTRTNGVPGFAMVASAGSYAARCTELHRSRGTPFGQADDAVRCI
jgi:hypothetical protein